MSVYIIGPVLEFRLYASFMNMSNGYGCNPSQSYLPLGLACLHWCHHGKNCGAGALQDHKKSSQVDRVR